MLDILKGIASFITPIASVLLPAAVPIIATVGGVLGVIDNALNPQQQPASRATPATSALPIQSQKTLPEAIRKVIYQASACKCGTPSSNAAPPQPGAARLPAFAPVVGNPTNASTQIKDGQAVFENDNYIITAGDKNTVSIYNKKTKEVYESVGSADMKIDDQAGFASKGSMSLMLNDGTKVTLGKADDGEGGLLAAKLTITNGSYGAQIKGIDSENAGGLAVQEFAEQGQALDEQVEDGVEIEENQDININNGRGFVAKDMNGAATIISNEYFAKVNKTGAPAEKTDQFDLPSNDAVQPRSVTAEMQKEIKNQEVRRTPRVPRPVNSNGNSIQNPERVGNPQQPKTSKKPVLKPRVPPTFPAPVPIKSQEIPNSLGNGSENIAFAKNPPSNRFALYA